MENDTRAAIQGTLRSVYKGFSDNYLNHYPHMEFLADFSLENLQYMNRGYPKTESWTKKQHIYWIISQEIRLLRFKEFDEKSKQIDIIFVRSMMQNDADFYIRMAEQTLDIDSIKKHHKYNCEQAIDTYYLSIQI